MCKRIIAVLLSFGMLFVNIPGAWAAMLHVQTLSGSGTLAIAGATSLTAALEGNPSHGGTPGDGLLRFAPTATDLIPQADELIRVEFDANNDSAGNNFKSITIATDNKYSGTGVTGDTTPASPLTTSNFPAGLVHTTATTYTVPLHWTVFNTAAKAQAYVFQNFTLGVDPEFVAPGGSPRTQSEDVDTRIQLFVSDKSGNMVDHDMNPATPRVLQDCDANDPNGMAGVQAFCPGYASLAYDLSGTTATNTTGKLANVPLSLTCENSATPDPQLCDNANSPEGVLPNNRPAGSNTLGAVMYVLLAANFKGAPAGTYTTSKLRIQMVNLAP